MAFVIEQGVDKPATSRGRKATEFPFKDMSVKDSFLIPIEAEQGSDAHKKAVDSWRRKILNAKKRFAEEFEGEFGTAVVKGGLRVWRTA